MTKILHPMEMLTHELAKKHIDDAGLFTAVTERNGREVVFIAKDLRKDMRATTYPNFFRILDERNLGVFMDPKTGYMKIMGRRNQKA